MKSSASRRSQYENWICLSWITHSKALHSAGSKNPIPFQHAPDPCEKDLHKVSKRQANFCNTKYRSSDCYKKTPGIFYVERDLQHECHLGIAPLDMRRINVIPQ